MNSLLSKLVYVVFVLAFGVICRGMADPNFTGDPDLAVEPGNFSFTAYEDGSNPEPEVLTIRNTGGGVLNWSIDISDKPEWLSLSPLSGSASSDPNENGEVMVSVDITDLSAGQYAYTFEVSDPAAQNSPQTVTVDVEVYRPMLSVSSTSFRFSTPESGLNPDDQTLVIKNLGGGTLNWSIDTTDRPGWLAITPLSSSLGPNESEPVILTVDTTGLAISEYTYQFKVSDPAAADSPRTVTVILIVNSNYGGGSGTADDPYQIWTPEQMNLIGANSSDWGKHFKLMADIDLSMYTGTQFNMIESFSGVFDGNGYTISNFTHLTTSESRYVGLFGRTYNGAVLKNIRLENVTISTHSKYSTGGLVGMNYGTIENCHVTGSVAGGGYVGGLIGWNRGPSDIWYVPRSSYTSVKNCTADCEVVSIGSFYFKSCSIGGLIGLNQESHVLSCFASGPVSDQGTTTSEYFYAGGLIGWNLSGTIRCCRFNGDVNCTAATYTGGLVGQNGIVNNSSSGPRELGDAISHCYVSGEITGGNYTGGLVGYHLSARVSHCYSSCIIHGLDYVGGLIGYSQSARIVSCGANSSVTGNYYTGGLMGVHYKGDILRSYANSSVNGTEKVGGLAGWFYSGTLTDSYSAGAVSGTDSDAGGLVGRATQGTLTNCYSAATVGGTAANQGGFIGWSSSTMTSCFWDIEASGASAGIGDGSTTGVFGQTTEQMQTLSTFTSTEWDFDIDDGDAADWELPDGMYPALICHPHAGSSSYSGGSGSFDDPYQISTVSDFYQLTMTPDDWSKYFMLTTDFDFDGTIFTESPVAPDRDPINSGFQGIPFTGIFDGNGHTIRNLRIETADNNYTGLFGRIAGGKIRNLHIENADIHGQSYVGGLAGSNYYGIIDNCQITGLIRGTEFVGGLIGFNTRGTLISCDASCSVNGSSSVGGLAGENGCGIITHCRAGNSVMVEGLSTYSYGGGLTGFNSGTIEYSCCTGGVIADGNDISIGGITGVHYSGDITSVYTTGRIISDSISSNYTGGFAGYMSGGSTNYSYSTSAVTVTGISGSVGGFIGETEPQAFSIRSCFWDIESSGLTYSSGGKAVTSQLMKSLTVFQNAGWANKEWIINDGVDTPRLSWENSSGITIPLAEVVYPDDNIYYIYTAEEFASLSWKEWMLDKDIKLMNDLDLSNIPLFPIGDLGPFTGRFDGNGHTLYNVTIHQPGSDYIGLFSSIRYKEYQSSGYVPGFVRNLKLVNADIIGNDYVGGLTGAVFKGAIISCSCSGSVKATGLSVGGLTGYSFNNGRGYGCGIWDSYASCSVDGTKYVGGLIGTNYKSPMFYSYMAGPVTGTDGSVGGLIGHNPFYFYAVESCWDTQTTGQSNGVGLGVSTGMTGKSTAEMMTQSTFTDWDFGSDWVMLREGEDYPRLAWEKIFSGDIAGLYGVDLVDFAYLANYWGLDDCGGTYECGRSDIDESGDVGMGDIVIIAEDWLCH